MIAREATVREIIFIIQLPFVFLDSQPNDAYPSAAGGLAISYDKAWPKERIPPGNQIKAKSIHIVRNIKRCFFEKLFS